MHFVNNILALCAESSGTPDATREPPPSLVKGTTGARCASTGCRSASGSGRLRCSARLALEPDVATELHPHERESAPPAVSQGLMPVGRCRTAANQARECAVPRLAICALPARTRCRRTWSSLCAYHAHGTSACDRTARLKAGTGQPFKGVPCSNHVSDPFKHVTTSGLISQ